MVRGRTFVIVSLVVSLLAFVPCGFSQSKPLKKIRVGVPAIGMSNIIIFITKEARLFEKYGLDAEVITMAGSGLTSKALIGGSIQIAPIATPTVINADLAGADMVILAHTMPGVIHALMVKPEIKRVEDLKGKKIAISSFGSLTDMLTREILTNHGLKPMKDVLLLQTGGAPVRLAALESNNVQGALLSSQQALAAKRDGYRFLNYDPPPYVSHPLIAKNEMLEKEPQTVRSLLRAVLKGHLFYGQKPEETITVVQKFLRINDRNVARETYEDEMRRYNPGGGFEADKMRRVIERARETRKIQRKVGIQDVFDLSLAAQVQAELKKSGWKP